MTITLDTCPRPLRLTASRMAAMLSSFAGPMNPQVLTISTSASFLSATNCTARPSAPPSAPSISSPSTWFFRAAELHQTHFGRQIPNFLCTKQRKSTKMPV